MIMTESSFDFRINENNRSKNGDNSQCNTYDMDAEISVDKRWLADRGLPVCLFSNRI